MAVIVALGVAVVLVGGVLFVLERHQPQHDPAAVQVDGQAVAESSRRHPALRRFLERRRDPATATGLLLTIGLAATAAAALAVGALLEMVTLHTGIADWDNWVARWGARHATPGSTAALKFVTLFGASYVLIPITALVALIEYRRLRSPAVPLFLASVLASELIVDNLVKVLVDRRRPDIARLVHAAGSSFPSGHSATAAAMWAAYALLLGRRRSARTRAILATAAGVMAVAVAASRVLLGVHWLTDVLAGLVLGWGCFALCSVAFGGRLLQFGHTLETAEYDVEPNAVTSGTPSP